LRELVAPPVVPGDLGLEASGGSCRIHGAAEGWSRPVYPNFTCRQSDLRYICHTIGDERKAGLAPGRVTTGFGG
jgi:hypothetical protein